MAYTYAYTGHGSPSTILRSDGLEFPQEPGLKPYEDWLIFGAGGGTTTAAASITLTDRKNAAKQIVNDQAADQRKILTHATVAEDLGNALRFKEAQDYEALSGAGTYTLLDAEVGWNGADTDEVHDNVLAELADLKTGLATIEGVRREAFDDIDGCADQTEIDAVLAAIDWTP